jgi:small subunit ribosomal protein S6
MGIFEESSVSGRAGGRRVLGGGILRNYETVFIMDPSLGDDAAAAEIAKARSAVESASGEILSVQKWGKRKLAYEIMKRREGIYAVIKFSGDGAAVSELERNFRLSEPVIRFMTVVDNSPSSEVGAEEAEAKSTDEAAAAAAAGETVTAAPGVPGDVPAAEGTATAPAEIPVRAPAEGAAATPLEGETGVTVEADLTEPSEGTEGSEEKSSTAAAPETPPADEPPAAEGEGSTTTG